MSLSNNLAAQKSAMNKLVAQQQTLLAQLTPAQAATVTPGLNAGKSIVSLLPAWQSGIANYAKADGYQVTTR